MRKQKPINIPLVLRPTVHFWNTSQSSVSQGHVTSLHCLWGKNGSFEKKYIVYQNTDRVWEDTSFFHPQMPKERAMAVSSGVMTLQAQSSPDLPYVIIIL